MPQQPDRKLTYYNIEAERAVLGAILQHRDAIIAVAPLLKATDFYRDVHGLIYAAARACYDRRVPPDLVTVGAELDKREQLEHVGGMDYLSGLSEAVPTAVHVEYYVGIVQREARLRRFVSAVAQIGPLAAADPDQVPDPFAAAMEILSQAAESAELLAAKSSAEVAGTLLDEMRSSNPVCLPTFGYRYTVDGPDGESEVREGLPVWDEVVMMRPGALLLLAARPSIGKTSAGECIADANAMAGRHVLFTSLETLAEDLGRRRLCRLAGLSWGEACNLRDLGPNKKALVAQVLAEVEDWPGSVSYLDTSADLAALRLECMARLAAERLDLLIVDYVQIIEEDGRSLVEINTRISKALKKLARDLEIPVLGISQLNRGKTENGEPELENLRESGQYEQDAHAVIFLWSEKDKEGHWVEEAGYRIVHWKVGKNRNGPLGQGTIFFDGPRFLFQE